MTKKLYINQEFLLFLELLTQVKKIENIQKLSYRLQIPRRKMYYHLSDLNSFLNANMISPIIRKQDVLEITSEQQLFLKDIIENRNAVDYIYKPRERQCIIALNILSEHRPVYLQDIMYFLNISRNTAIADIKVVKNLLTQANNLVIIQSERGKGYHVIISEFERRKIMYYLVSQLTDYKANLTSGYIGRVLWEYNPLLLKNKVDRDLLQQMTQAFPKIDKILGKSLTFKDKKVFRAIVFLVLYRMTANYQVTWDREEQKVLQQFVEYQAATAFFEQLNLILAAELPQDERYFITVLLLSARKDVDQHNKSDKFIKIREVVLLMIEKFELYSGVHFDNKEILKEHLITHVKALFYRNRYGIVFENMLTETVMERYPDVYRITRECSNCLEEYLEIVLTDAEIAYLAVHFGSQLIENTKPVYKKKMLLVSNLGIGMSGMFFQQIQQLLPEMDIVSMATSEETQLSPPEIDFCVTTETAYHHPYGQTIHVSAILTESDIWRLFSICKNDMSNKNYPKIERKLKRVFKQHGIQVEQITPDLVEDIFSTLHDIDNTEKKQETQNLNTYFTSETLFTCHTITDLDEAIDILGQPLLESGKIKKLYLDKIKEYVETNPLSLSIAPGCLLLHHHYKNGSIDSGISMLYIKDGYRFKYKDANNRQEEVMLYVLFLVATAESMEHVPIIFSIDQALKNGLMKDIIEQKNLDVIHTY